MSGNCILLGCDCVFDESCATLSSGMSLAIIETPRGNGLRQLGSCGSISSFITVSRFDTVDM